MTPIETVTAAILVMVGLLLAAAAGLALIRIVRGPSLLDRMIASDMLLTTIILVVGAEMVVGKHARNVPMMLVLAAIAIFATVAVARYVSKQDRPAQDREEQDAEEQDTDQFGADQPDGAEQDPTEEDAVGDPAETAPADHALETSQGVSAQDTAEDSR